MLSICRVALGGEDYYLATAASGRDHGEGLVEPAGVWLGAGSERLGLSVSAEPRAVRQLLAGIDPASGEVLLGDGVRRRIAAFDCTFSVPKSVSLVQAFSPDAAVREQMRLGHEAAVRVCLGYLEREAAAVRLSGVDGRRVVRGDELVGVGFLHRLSRAGDPHLHTHVLVANLVPDAFEGVWRPLDATGLFVECRTAGALYETHLRYELTARLGVEWQPLDGRCWSDLKGLDRDFIRSFSQRSAQIEAGMVAEGWQGPAARRAMAELTRPPKDRSRSHDEVIEDARPRLWKAGVTETRLLNVCYRVPVGAPGGALELAGDGEGHWQDEALRQLPARTVDGSFTLRDAIRARCATAREGRTVDAVQADARMLLADERVLGRGEHTVRLRGGATGSFPAGRSEPLYTTREIVAAEDRILGIARSMVAERPGSLTAISYKAGRRFEALDSLSAAAASWREEGRSVLALAPGRWAAAGIESACGIDAVVVPGVRRHWGRPDRPDRVDSPVAGVPIEPGSVVVVAGAPSYGPEALQEILEICRSAQASVVLLGTQRALERGRVLFEVAAMADGRLPGRADPLQPSFESLTCAWRSIGSVEVAVVGSLSHACDEAARRLDAAPSARTLSGPDGGGRPLLVAGDEAIVAALRSRPGVQSGDVVHTRDLKEVLAARTGEIPHLVVVGGASVLRQGATASPNVARSHVLVAPGIAPASVEALGRAAEAARPRYLTTPLGVPLTELDERQAWRTAASAIESYRDRWQITDGGRAYGAPVPSLQVGSEQAASLAALERRAAEVRGLDRARSGRQLEGPGLGLGR